MNKWQAEEFLTGEFENNLGTHCKLEAKDGKITGKYFTKVAQGKLTQPGFEINGIYTPVKDDALISMIVVYKVEKEKEDSLEGYSHAIWNGKVYSKKK